MELYMATYRSTIKVLQLIIKSKKADVYLITISIRLFVVDVDVDVTWGGSGGCRRGRWCSWG